MHNARNTLIPALLALLLSIGAYVYIFREVQNAGREVSSIERQISEEHEKARRREAVRSTLTDTEADRAELDSRLVSEGSLVSFFENIEGLAIESGVETEFARISESVELEKIVPPSTEDGQTTKPVPNPASSHLEWLQMDISATGSWAEVYRFLTLVELLPYETVLSNIRLEEGAAPEVPPTEEGEEVAPPPPGSQWMLSFTLKVLKLKE